MLADRAEDWLKHTAQISRPTPIPAFAETGAVRDDGRETGLPASVECTHRSTTITSRRLAAVDDLF